MVPRVTEPVRVSPEEMMRRMDLEEEFLILDARPRQSYRLSPVRILGAKRLPPSDIDRVINEVPREKPLVIYCDEHSEATSGRVARVLLERGWCDVRVLRGGFDAWLRAGYPVETKD